MVVAKTVKSYNWFIHVDGPHEFLKTKLSDICGWIDYDGMCWALHVGKKDDNPHAHICLKLTSCIQKQSLGTRIKNLFGVTGGQFSIVPWDLKDEALQYLFHENNGDVEFFNGLQLDSDRIQTLKHNCKLVVEAVEKAKEKASHRVVEKVLELIDKSCKQWTAYEIGFEIQKMVWRREVYDPGNFLLERYVYEILAKQCQNLQDLESMWNDRCRQLKCFN